MAPYQGTFTLLVTVLLMTLLSQTYGGILHVRPTSTNTSCHLYPTYPCHTLSEYAQDHENYLHDSVITLKFMPGFHTLSMNLDIDNIQQLEILGHSSTITTTVECIPNVGFAFSNISRVRITGLTFASCTRSYQDIHPEYDATYNIYLGVYLELIQMTEIVDCTFQDSFGTALGINASHVVITGSNSFINNCRKCSNGGCNFKDPKCFGGGVYVVRSSLSFCGDSSFIENVAYYGGGIAVQSNSNVSISGNSTFNGNSATHGGGIYVHSDTCVNISGNTSFINNSAREGGGISTKIRSTVKVNENTTFIHNSAWYGGGVYAKYSNSVNMSGNTSFISNSAKYNGGGVCAFSISNVNISGNTAFINNSAGIKGFGGGLYAQAIGNIGINGNTTLIGNSARNGGGVYARSSSNVNLSGNTTFSNNLADWFGGGVYACDRSSVNIQGIASFVDNSASKDGGGVYAAQNNNVSISGNSTFNGNSAIGKGGGVFASPNCNVNFSGNASFIVNSATSGGGVCVIDSGMLLHGIVTFCENVAQLDGGGAYVESSNLNFSGVITFRNNSATHDGGAICALESFFDVHGENIFLSNLARSGGAIYTRESSLRFTTTSVCTIADNMAELDGGGIYVESSSLDCRGNITIASNIAEVGGGIYSENNTLNINGHNVVKGNVAVFHGGGMYIRRTPLYSAGNNTFSTNSAREGGGIHATVNSSLDFDGESSFKDNHAHISGGGIWLDNSNLTVSGNSCFVDSVASYEGGGIFAYASTVYLPGNNAFISNSATTGGGIHARWSYINIADSTSLKNNVAVFGGGIFTDNSTFESNGSSSFRNNHATYTGGGMYAARSYLTFLGTSSVTSNHADRDGGGLYTRDGCIVNLHGLNRYVDNSAEGMGGGISAVGSIFNLAGKNVFDDNKAAIGGGFYMVNCTTTSPGDSTFIGNSASSQGGGFATAGSALLLNGSTFLGNNSAHTGGGMYIDDSTVHVDGNNYFMNNTASLGGGAIYAQASVVKHSGKDVFMANSAGSKGGSVFAILSNIKMTGNSLIQNSVSTQGGAIYTSFTTLIFQGCSSFVNNSAKYGGAIQSESSEIFINSRTIYPQPYIRCKVCNDISNISLNSFFNNTAIRGGAFYLDQYSNTSLYPSAHACFQGNEASEFGGAIYVVDVPSSGQFLPLHTTSRSECFFHILGNEQSSDLETPPLVFENNSAGKRGSAVYGGLLSLCNFTSPRYTSALDFFNRSILPGGEKDMDFSISSDPTQICFCNWNAHNCTELVQSRRIYPGQDIEVSVITVDQSRVAIPTSILGDLRSGRDQDSYVSETILYETGENCTCRNYPVTPKNLFNQLELYPSNRSGNTIHLTVTIIFENCPIGFELSNFSSECICDHRLWQFTNTCDINTQSIRRTAGAKSTFWLGVSYNNKIPQGFIYHHHCPIDYCTREHKYINLKNPNDQCNFNRSGLLCGKCIQGYSLVLGSSQCKKCSNKFLALLIPFALAGVLLVILLFLLQLTVAKGTLHGLIFYANIVAANHHIFIPQSSSNPASIFIAWLNLDLGIQTCFYDGMNGFSRIWLEFVFPVYVWGIVGFLVYISDRSTIVTKLLGSSAVPVLATLFLLSYAKLLRTIITALSLTILYYPYHSEVVWIQDANIPLTKYIFLALAALLFLLFLFVPYTLLLLLGQWLQPKSHLRLLSWVRNPKVKAILDSYYAPYKQNHRYWTGLLLLLRGALFLVFAFNVSGNDSVNLLVISLTTLAISVAFGISGMVYKSVYLNALELSFILNLGVLAVATHHVNLSDGNQDAVGYFSVGITFLTFVGIVSYHIFLRIKSKLQYIQRGRQLRHRNKQSHDNNGEEDNGHPGNLEHQRRVNPTITYTVVDLQELRSPLDLLDTK